ncbi:MAG TPA: serine/threonine-protein kinase, partial [Vicinamibacteria bacterium]
MRARVLMPTATNLVRGDVLAGRYEILREIGSGGMGRVFEAYDRALKERVAVKVLKSAPDEESRSRFLNEVKLARKIRHRNVVGLHEYGEEGDVPYFSMEFVEGEDLRHLIRARTALDWEAAYALAEQIGAGLQAAHEMGVVHRDLKPANVMIEPSGQVRVMDFGVAKGGGERGATQVGMVLGTPEYMSPEQVLASDIDARSDVYAFGVVIHEMFTGTVPFSGLTAMATMLMHVENPVPLDPPHERLPGPLVPILRKALAKSRDDRYGSCGEMLEALAAARRQQGTDPLPTPPGLGDSGKGATILSVPKVDLNLPATAVPS